MAFYVLESSLIMSDILELTETPCAFSVMLQGHHHIVHVNDCRTPQTGKRSFQLYGMRPFEYAWCMYLYSIRGRQIPLSPRYESVTHRQDGTKFQPQVLIYSVFSTSPSLSWSPGCCSLKSRS